MNEQSPTLRIKGRFKLSLRSIPVILFMILFSLGAIFGASYLALRSQDARWRDPVMVVFIQIGDPTVPALVKVLQDPGINIAARRASAIALGQIQSPKAIIALVEALDNENPELQSAIQDTLAALGEISIQPLIEALQDDRLRASACAVLVRISKSFPIKFDFIQVNMSNLNLAGAVFIRDNLAEAVLTGSDLTGTNFQGADLTRASLDMAVLNQANLISTTLSGANLRNASLFEADLTGSNVTSEQLAIADTLVGIGLSNHDLSLTDLSGLDLTGANLSGSNLSGSVFTGTIFVGLDLSGTNLIGSNLTGEQLAEAYSVVGIKLTDHDLKQTNLSGVNFTAADLSRTDFQGADLSGVIFEGANLSDGNFSDTNIQPDQLHQAETISGVNLSGLNFSQADLSGLDLSTANLKSTNLHEANLEHTNFEGASLENANLSSSNVTGSQLKTANLLKGINLENTNLNGADLSGVDFSSARLSFADLSDTDLSEAKIYAADLSDANLSMANLDKTVLEASDLSRANFTGSNLTLVQLISSSKWRGIILQKFDFSKADLSVLDFSEADFSGAIFKDTDLTLTNLSGANLSGADLSGAILKDTNLISATGVTVDGLLTAKDYGAAKLQKPEEFYAQIDQACFGYAIPNAYQGKAGFHPVVGRWENSLYSFTPDTIPLWMGIVELVACVRTEEVIVQTCRNYYSVETGKRGPDFQRVRLNRVASLFKASTGELVESKTFEGTIPRTCQSTEEAPIGWDATVPRQINGNSVENQQIVDWLLPYSNSEIEAGRLAALTSTITLMELLVQPFKQQREDVARKYEVLLANFPHLQLVELDRNVIRRAARIRAEYAVRPPDALQAAACLVNGAAAFITNDIRLSGLRSLFDLVLLQDYVQKS